MPEEKANPIEAGEKKVEALVKSEPWYVWAGALAAAGMIGYILWRRRQAAASDQSQAATDAIPPATDTAGGPAGYGYQAGPVDNYPSVYGETGVNGNNVPVIPFGDTPLYDPNGNLIGFQQPSPTISPAPAPAKVSFTTKAAGSLETTPRDIAGGKNILTVPSNASVDFISGPIPDPQGTAKQYYLVNYAGKIGYIGSDVLNLPKGDGGFHVPINAGRNTVDQVVFANGMHRDFDSGGTIDG